MMAGATERQTVAPPLTVVLEAVRSRIRERSSLFLFDFQDRRALFRTDGLIVELTNVAYDLLHEGATADDAVARSARAYGNATVHGCLEQLAACVEQRQLLAVLPDRLPEEHPRECQSHSLTIFVAQTCNLRCIYCYGGDGTYGSKRRRVPERDAMLAVDHLMSNAPNRDRYNIIFFGGEPLTNFSIIRRTVEYCERRASETGKRFQFSITTNATLLTDEVIDFLKIHHFSVMVSLDGPAAIQDKYRPMVGGRGSFSIVSDAVRRLNRAGISPQVRATVVKESVSEGHIQEIVESIASLGCARIAMSPVDSSTDGRASYALESLDQQRLGDIFRRVTKSNLEAFARGEERDIVFDPNVRTIRALWNGNICGKARCGACYGSTAVSVDGDLYPCHRFVGMQSYKIGRLANGVNPRMVKRFYENVRSTLAGHCDGCYAKLICGGWVCFHRIADGRGGFVVPDEGVCISVRENLKSSIGHVLDLRAMSEVARQRYMRATRYLI